MALTVGQLAAIADLKPDTVRYYGRIGILPESDRSEGGYRLYDDTAVERLAFIRRVQRLGLRLDEIRELLEIRDRGACPCGHTRMLLQRRLSDLDEEIERLQGLREQLAQMLHREPSPDGGGDQGWRCLGSVI